MHKWRLHLTQESVLGKAGRSLRIAKRNKTSSDEKSKTKQQQKTHHIKWRSLQWLWWKWFPCCSCLPHQPMPRSCISSSAVRPGEGGGSACAGESQGIHVLFGQLLCHWANPGINKAEVKKACRQVSAPGELFQGIREEAEDLCQGSVILKDACTSYCSCESTRTLSVWNF